jgi:hypothetical protein
VVLKGDHSKNEYDANLEFSARLKKYEKESNNPATGDQMKLIPSSYVGILLKCSNPKREKDLFIEKNETAIGCTIPATFVNRCASCKIDYTRTMKYTTHGKISKKPEKRCK